MNQPEEIQSKLEYNPLTGVIKWKQRHNGRIKPSLEAGFIAKDGYRKIRVAGKMHKAHRIAWLLHTGSMPTHELDHENRNRSDNRWENIRKATRNQNAHNQKTPVTNKSGVKGVSWHKGNKSWRATLKHNGKTVFQKYFPKLEDAADAIKVARLEFHKEFSAH